MVNTETTTISFSIQNTDFFFNKDTEPNPDAADLELIERVLDTSKGLQYWKYHCEHLQLRSFIVFNEKKILAFCNTTGPVLLSYDNSFTLETIFKIFTEGKNDIMTLEHEYSLSYANEDDEIGKYYDVNDPYWQTPHY